jgi:AraC-like DNA-binding protein
MSDILYNYSLIVLAVVLFVLGLLLFFLKMPVNLKSGAYRNASRAMTFTFLFFGLVNIFEFLERFGAEGPENALLCTVVTLVIASVQAFLFTYAVIALINKQVMRRRQITVEIVAVALFLLLGINTYLFAEKTITVLFAYLYTAFYFSQLIRYSLIFNRLYRQSVREMDNYYSGQETERMHWIRVSFFSALAIGLMALLLTLFPNAMFGIACTLVCLVFYVYFAIRFINYAFIFNTIEEVLNEEPEGEPGEESMPESTVNESFSTLDSRIAQWIADKQFTKQGITIKDTAQQLNTNRNYLSAHINQNKNKTFREWINFLRIDYAKSLLAENPEMELWKIAERTGYTDSKYFSTQFKHLTGKTPVEFRNVL